MRRFLCRETVRLPCREKFDSSERRNSNTQTRKKNTGGEIPALPRTYIWINLCSAKKWKKVGICRNPGLALSRLSQFTHWASKARQVVPSQMAVADIKSRSSAAKEKRDDLSLFRKHWQMWQEKPNATPAIFQEDFFLGDVLAFFYGRILGLLQSPLCFLDFECLQWQMCWQSHGHRMDYRVLIFLPVEHV